MVPQKSSSSIRRGSRFAREDEGISPIIATILLIAVAVILGATVYAAVSGFGSKAPKEATNAAFRSTLIDSDNDGKTDRIKLTYLSGPSNADVTQNVHNATNVPVSPIGACPTSMSPGEFCLYKANSPTGAAGAYSVTVRVVDTTVLDQTLSLDE